MKNKFITEAEQKIFTITIPNIPPIGHYNCYPIKELNSILIHNFGIVETIINRSDKSLSLTFVLKKPNGTGISCVYVAIVSNKIESEKYQLSEITEINALLKTDYYVSETIEHHTTDSSIIFFVLQSYIPF